VGTRDGLIFANLTVVYDLERRVLLWVGDDRTEEAVKPFFTREMGARRCHTLRVICMGMWAAYANLVKEHAPQAQIRAGCRRTFEIRNVGVNRAPTAGSAHSVLIVVLPMPSQEEP
jgi:transposase